jgi:hypothetical protein
MGITATNTGGTDFKQPSAGNHLGRLYQIVDIGTHHDQYLGEPTIRRQAIFRWELPHETEVFDGVTKPLIVSKFYTLSTSEKANLRKDVQGWLARNLSETEARFFDVTTLLNQYCMLSIVMTDKGKAKVIGVGAVPKGFPPPPAPFNPTSFFSMDNWDDAAFEKLPKGFQDLVRQSDEYRILNTQDAPPLAPVPKTVVKTPMPGAKTNDFDDDIPF